LLGPGFFKAALFLGAGSVMHGMNDQVDIRRFGGLWRSMGITWATFGVAWLAIIGIPPLSGFFTKEPIIVAAFERPGWTGWLYGGGRVVGAPPPPFFITRLFVLPFHGPKRWTEDIDHPHESPLVMTIPLMLLAVGSVAAGFLMRTSVVDWLTPVFEGAPEEAPAHHLGEATIEWLGLGVTVLGGLIAWAL